MDIKEKVQIRALKIDSIEKIMDEFVGTANNLRGLFKNP